MQVVVCDLGCVRVLFSIVRPFYSFFFLKGKLFIGRRLYTCMSNSEECIFCPVEKKTHWYEESKHAIFCEKPHGGPLVILKRHTTEPTEKELKHCHDLVRDYVGDHDFRVLMTHVPNHWHAHVQNYDSEKRRTLLDEV